MHCTRQVTDTVVWVGASDRRLAKFENLFPIPRGVSYNSYLIRGTKNVLMDTTDDSVGARLLENVRAALQGGALDYIVVQHMEPDHAATLVQTLRVYPSATVVCNAKTAEMMQRFFGADAPTNLLIVKDGETLDLGDRQLQFIFAPMVHWPEVMVTYDSKDKILFSADAFGSFGAIDGGLFDDEVDFERDWLDDARRYYVNIVGKYGAPVQTLFRKTAALDIAMFCPLHGIVWRSNLCEICNKYQAWSTYTPEQNGVWIAYASMYGNTQNLADVLACRLTERGVKGVKVCDISVTDMSELTANAFRYSHTILLAPTYNGEMYPMAETFLGDLRRLGLRNRTFALGDNGTWAATAGKQMRTMLEGMKDVRILDATVSIRSALQESDAEAVDAFVEAVVQSL